MAMATEVPAKGVLTFYTAGQESFHSFEIRVKSSRFAVEF